MKSWRNGKGKIYAGFEEKSQMSQSMPRWNKGSKLFDMRAVKD